MKSLMFLLLAVISVGCATSSYSKIDQYECEVETAPIYRGQSNEVRLGAIYDCLHVRAATGKLKGPISE